MFSLIILNNRIDCPRIGEKLKLKIKVPGSNVI